MDADRGQARGDVPEPELIIRAHLLHDVRILRGDVPSFTRVLGHIVKLGLLEGDGLGEAVGRRAGGHDDLMPLVAGRAMGEQARRVDAFRVRPGLLEEESPVRPARRRSEDQGGQAHAVQQEVRGAGDAAKVQDRR